MSFDTVHDVQRSFRGLVRAFSFPGRPVDLADQALRLAPRVGDPGVNPALALGAAVLVDQDASYAVVGHAGLASFLVEWSSSAPCDLSSAALVVVADFDDPALADVLDRVDRGTLTDPHRGATVLVGVVDLDVGTPWTWTGPGLEGPTLGTLPTGQAWVAARNRATHEFPLGIDLAFFDLRGRVVALPRTTRLGPATETGGRTWPM